MATTWTVRVQVTTTWEGRKKPEILIEPLQDAYTEVADEDNEIIYIISDEWKPVAMTNWKPRKSI